MALNIADRWNRSCHETTHRKLAEKLSLSHECHGDYETLDAIQKAIDEAIILAKAKAAVPGSASEATGPREQDGPAPGVRGARL